MNIGEALHADSAAAHRTASRSRRHFTHAQKLALDDIYSKHAELRFHGGAEGALTTLKGSHPDHFRDETAGRINNWFKERQVELQLRRPASANQANEMNIISGFCKAAVAHVFIDRLFRQRHMFDLLSLIMA